MYNVQSLSTVVGPLEVGEGPYRIGEKAKKKKKGKKIMYK